jgi:hypothetical protein
MGLDMRPLGKPKKGFEKRYVEIFKMVESDNIPKPTFLDKLKGKKFPTKDELIQEWFENQIPTYETIKAPMVGRDQEAEEWLKEKYEELEKKPTWEEFLKEHQGFYVITTPERIKTLASYLLRFSHLWRTSIRFVDEYQFNSQMPFKFFIFFCSTSLEFTSVAMAMQVN